MNFITAEELEAYVNKYTDDKTLLEMYCNAGMEAVADYLGYSPESTELEVERYGMDSLYLALDAPVIEIESAEKDGEEIDVLTLKVSDKNLLEFSNRSKFNTNSVYKIKYKGGFSEVPSKIKNTALQIAAMYWERAGGNLAVNSISLADGTRQFSNRSPSFFLSEIEQYKILRF